MRTIRDLTEQEAKEILAYVYPTNDYWFTGLSFDPVVTPDGRQQITFGGRSIIGIKYHNGQDNCILHFDNTKIINWLYKHGFDISEQLQDIENLTDRYEKVSSLTSEFAFITSYENIIETRKKNGLAPATAEYNFEFVQKQLTKLTDRWFDME